MQQLLQFDDRAQSGQLLEDFVQVFADFRVRSHQADVGVHAAVGLVVVAGGQMRVAAQCASFATHDQHHLGVGFVADHAVDDLHPGFLQTRGQANIGFLVEACAQFDHHRDVFAVARSLHQQADQRSVFASAIEGLFDRQHLRVGGGLAQQVDYRGEALIGMVQKHVALGDQLELAVATIQVGRQL